MTAATSAVVLQPSEVVASRLFYRLAGLAFATMLPAFFWVTLAAMVGPSVGITLSASALIFTGVAIALFLGSVCAPIVLSART
jgi:hypothetical protein